MTENYRLPENAEASIVGCVLLCPDTKPAVAKLVSEGDFSSPAYGAMFLAAMELDEPDSTAFHDAVKRRGYSLPDGFFAGLGDVAVSRHNVELYARLLREDSQKRQLKELSRQIRELTDEETEAAEIITTAASCLQKIERGSITGDIAAPDDSFRAFWEHRKRVESGAGAVPTGFTPLDTILGGGYATERTVHTGRATRNGQKRPPLCNLPTVSRPMWGRCCLYPWKCLWNKSRVSGSPVSAVSPQTKSCLGNGKNLDYRKIRSAAEELKICRCTSPAVLPLLLHRFGGWQRVFLISLALRRGSHGIWFGTLGRFRPGRLGYRFSRPRYSVGFKRASAVCGGFSSGPLADLRAYIVSPLRAVLSAALLFPSDNDYYTAIAKCCQVLLIRKF